MMPDFLNPITAAIAAAIAVPLLLFLYFLKLRRQERAISSTLLWKKAIQDLQVNAPFQRLRRNLLLFLQMLLLILLLLALARPVVTTLPAAGQVSVILLDRSASMSTKDVNGTTRLQEAQRLALDLVNSMKRGGQAMVIAFDQTAQTLQPFTTDTATLRRAIETVQPTDRLSKLKLAFQLADAQLAFIPENNRSVKNPPDVWLYSDGKVQDGGEDLTLRGNLKYVKLGSPDAENVAIVALSAHRNFQKPTEVQVYARLANFGPRPVNTDVQLSINGTLTRVAAVSLAPERWADPAWIKTHAAQVQKDYIARNSVEFTLDLPNAATVKVEHTFREDVLPADDAAWLVVPPPRQLKVLLVTEGNYFLEKAMEKMPVKDAATVKPAVYDAKPPEDVDLIIFDRYIPPTLPPAGTFMYFASVPPDSKLKAVRENDAIVLQTDPVILDWRREHPILRHLLLSKIHIAQTMQLDLPLEAQVLVDSNRGPLMVLYREPRRLHLVVGFDLLDSDWPTRVSFPVFLNNAVMFMALSSQVNVRETLPPGSSPTIERALINRVNPQLKSLQLTGPINATVPIPPTGDCVLPPLNRVGLYRLSPAIAGADQFAVNLLSDPESNIIPADIPPGRSGQVIAAAAGKSRLELWWWIVAVAALPLLMIEWWVYTRRVHL